MENVQGLLTLLVGGGVLAFLGVLLTVRESRQKRYDDRTLADLERLRKVAHDAEDHARHLDKENDALREEVTRLRILCRSHGINPDEPVVNP